MHSLSSISRKVSLFFRPELRRSEANIGTGRCDVTSDVSFDVSFDVALTSRRSVYSQKRDRLRYIIKPIRTSRAIARTMVRRQTPIVRASQECLGKAC